MRGEEDKSSSSPFAIARVFKVALGAPPSKLYELLHMHRGRDESVDWPDPLGSGTIGILKTLLPSFFTFFSDIPRLFPAQ